MHQVVKTVTNRKKQQCQQNKSDEDVLLCKHLGKHRFNAKHGWNNFQLNIVHPLDGTDQPGLMCSSVSS